MENQPNIQNNNSSLENINSQTPQAEPEIKPKSNKIIPILIGVFFVCAISVVAYFLGSKNFFKKNIIVDNHPKETPNSTPTPEEVPLFSGQIQRLTQNLKLFKSVVYGYETVDSDVYYSAGIFNKGELKGYTRIIAIKKEEGPGDPYVYILATKDFETFILDDPNNNISKPEDNYQNPYSVLDKTKIISTKNFDTNQTNEISLDQKFSLYFKTFFTKPSETNKVDKYGNKIYEYTLITDFSSYQKLTSPVNNLTFYFKPYTNNQYFDQLNQSQKDKELIKEKYFSGETSIIVVDSTGLPLNYLLTTAENIKIYQQKNAVNDISLKGSVLPSFTFTSSAIENKNNLQFYKTYATAIPSGCSLSLSTKVININDNDLEQIGTVSNTQIYRLKDRNNPLYKLAFDNKMEYYNLVTIPSEWDNINKGVKKPTFEEYIDNNPLLFIKDYWQRWVALGEYDIQLPGGCGKPVIYLYPQKTTEISVKFNVPVQFTTDIPEYKNSWNVLASPNGSLKDLNQKDDDCNKIDSNKFGSEYAAEACKTNNYPYLYWAGNIISQKYPEINKGWIIDKKDINNFLEEKLTQVGLNSQEKKDFIRYWLPEMLAKNTPYYRVSFLQTSELNQLFPMTVEPRPDSIFRIFLDYLPLAQKPSQKIEPQSLNKIIREGFTLVEWGGLKR